MINTTRPNVNPSNHREQFGPKSLMSTAEPLPCQILKAKTRSRIFSTPTLLRDYPIGGASIKGPALLVLQPGHLTQKYSVEYEYRRIIP